MSTLHDEVTLAIWLAQDRVHEGEGDSTDVCDDAANEVVAAINEYMAEATAKAWDEGNSAGSEDSSHWNGYQMDLGYEETPNPHRSKG